MVTTVAGDVTVTVKPYENAVLPALSFDVQITREEY